MKLQEVCSATGLTKKTIRFYEEKELITPKVDRRNGRNFREYSQGDVDALLEIATLRKAWFTIDEIQRMKQDPETIRDIFPQYRQWLRQQKQELDILLAVAEQIDADDIDSISQLTQTMADAAETLPLPPVDIRPHFRYLDEIDSRPAVLSASNPMDRVLPGKKVQRQLTVLRSDEHNAASLMAVDTMNETSRIRKHPDSGPVQGKEPPYKAPALRTWQLRLLTVSLSLVLLAAFMPRIYILDNEYQALCCSNEAYDTLTEDFSTVTIRIHGIYLSTPFGNDRYYGTLHILDYPKDHKTSGGKFEPLELGETVNAGQAGGLWYYSEKREQYESLGFIYWNVQQEQIFIHNEAHYIVYPAASVADADALWTEMTMH